MARKANSDIPAPDAPVSLPISAAAAGAPVPGGGEASDQESDRSRDSGHPSDPGRRKTRQQRSKNSADTPIANDLSFREAQAALELSLAQLQASDLDVETMADLYRRAESYVQRCEDLLAAVEQNVLQWDPESVETPPQRFNG